MSIQSIYADHLGRGTEILSPSLVEETSSAYFAAKAPDLTSFDNTDNGNAERVHAYAGSNFHYVTESGQWLLWDGNRWVPDKNGGMTRLYVSVMKLIGTQAFEMTDRSRSETIVKHSFRSMDAAKVQAGLQMLKSILGVSISVNDLDADPWMIGTADGMIDLRAGIPITPDRSKLITKKIGARYDPTATCPTWEKFLHTVTNGDAELIQFLQNSVGYSLTGSTRDQCLFFLHGSGQNGKGVFSETVKRLLGDYGQVAPESMFVMDRNQSATNDIARLAGCRMAIAAELEEGASFAESRIKKLTGGDMITARFLHQEFFDFPPTHHFWISGNHKPTIKGSDLGIWRRIRLIPFTVRIAESEKDPDLAEKLAAEMSGILNWALEGCIGWQRDGLRTPRCVTQATDQYRAEEDVIGQFLTECITEDNDVRVLMSSLYECYQAWAEGEGIKRPMQAKAFNRQLDERGHHRIKSNKGRYWEGITINE
jgi:putative DNA primase/helicase